MSRVRAQSRFYGSASSEESSEEESERSDEEFEESDSDDDSDAGPGDRSRFLVGSDSEEEDEKREIKSGKVKRFEAMVDTSHKLRNHMKINDWISILTDYENLNLQLEKHMKRDIVSRKKPTVHVFLDNNNMPWRIKEGFCWLSASFWIGSGTGRIHWISCDHSRFPDQDKGQQSFP
mmetsp:Transcript_11602/g.48261  ORF Transcript_11602/g.48261 Transcript_11602/m.48261 type:complete len:177 (+) Transcript_11602:148-678(+)